MTTSEQDWLYKTNLRTPVVTLHNNTLLSYTYYSYAIEHYITFYDHGDLTLYIEDYTVGTGLITEYTNAEGAWKRDSICLPPGTT